MPRPSTPPRSRSASTATSSNSSSHGVDAAVAELPELAGHGVAVDLLQREQHRGAAAAGRRVEVGLHEQGEAVATAAVRDPGLRAVDDVGVAVAACRRADRLQVAAARRLGEREPAAQLSRRELREEVVALRVGAERADEVRHHQVRVQDAGERHPHRGDLRDDLGVGRRREAEPAVLGRDRGAEEPELAHLLDHRGRVLVGVVELDHVRQDVTLEPLRQDPPELVVHGPRLLRHPHTGCPASSAANVDTAWKKASGCSA